MTLRTAPPADGKAIVEYEVWLAAVESYASRMHKAPLALAALDMRKHPTLHRVVAHVLRELSKLLTGQAASAIYVGNGVSTVVIEDANELAGLLVTGWQVFERLTLAGRQ